MGKKENNHENGFTIWYAISFALQLGFIIAVTLIGFLLVGYWLDKVFNFSPLFLLIGSIIGFIISIYETRHILSTIIKK